LGFAAALVVGIAAVFFTGGSGSHSPGAQTAPTITIHGHVRVLGAVTGGKSIKDLGAACKGQGGYADVTSGAPVTVWTANGALIGTGQLGPGTVSALLTCSFPFTIAGVPDSAYYRVVIPHRGEVAYAKADLAAHGWDVETALGP
jgi:hypothetical protein